MKPAILWKIAKATFMEWWEDNPFRLAASLAFYTTFSLAPMLLIAVGIASLVFDEQKARSQIVRQIQSLTGSEGARAVAQALEGATRMGGNPTAIVAGAVALIMGSTAVFAELQSALNYIWDVQADPNRGSIKGFLRDRLQSFAIVLGIGFLLLVSLLISAALAAAREFLTGSMPDISWLWQTLDVIASFGIVTLLFAMIYKYLPDVAITWRDVGTGAVVTALLFIGGKFLIGLYLGQTAFGSIYGAAGSFVVLLIWVYYSALICFFGAEFTQVFARRYGSGIRPREHAVRVGRKADKV